MRCSVQKQTLTHVQTHHGADSSLLVKGLVSVWTRDNTSMFEKHISSSNVKLLYPMRSPKVLESQVSF